MSESSDDVAVLLARHAAVMPLLATAQPEIEAAVDLIVNRVGRGGRLVYVGAGTSGWLAALDAAEVVVTFGMAGRVDSVVGGGLRLDPVAMTLGDDAVESLADDPVIGSCGPADLAIAVSASGSTPFTVAAVGLVRAAGASVVAIVNRPGSPLSASADVTILAETAEEVVSGSTRLTAGLAQKAILNTLSTVSMVRLGRTLGGQMVCVEPLNDKLRARIVDALATATGVDPITAARALEQAGRGDVAAVALACRLDAAAARQLLSAHGDNIQAAIDAVHSA